MDTSLLALGVAAVGVIALVHRARLRAVAASFQRVEKRSDELGLVVASGLDSPRERQTRRGAGRHLQLVPVKAATLPSRDGGTVAPRGVRVAEPLPLRPVLRDVPLAIGESGHVGGVNSYVLSDVRHRGLEGGRYVIETVRERVGVRPQLDREAVACPHARAAPESTLQSGMICDQGRRTRPRREAVECLDERRPDQGAGAIAPATRPAERIQLRDQPSYFGRVEQRRDFTDGRATRYLSTCHSSPNLGLAGPREARTSRGPLFGFLEGNLQVGSDGSEGVDCS